MVYCGVGWDQRLKMFKVILQKGQGIVEKSGPYRSEGRPYRGPLESRTVSLTAAGLLTQSDGEEIPPRVQEILSRSGSDENMWEGWMGGILTLHAPKIPVYISLVVHVFGNCDLVRWSTRRYAHRYALSGVTTTMSTHSPCGSCGPPGKCFSTRSMNPT